MPDKAVQEARAFGRFLKIFSHFKSNTFWVSFGDGGPTKNKYIAQGF